eukprot:IDg21288t1
MEKLSDNNFHSWRQKMQYVLSHREVSNMVDKILCPRKPEDPDELSKWLRKDNFARMTIGLTLSDEMLKNVQHTTTALEMWTEICNVHQRHTLLNKLSARRDFYTASMRNGEKMMVYINRVRQMALTLESMNVIIDDKELAMAVLNGLLERYQRIITALDAIGDEDTSLTLDKVRSRLLQEEMRSQIRVNSNSTKAALFNRSEQQSSTSSRKKCTIANVKSHRTILLEEVWQAFQTNACALSSNVKAVPTRASTWHVDSAATSHITFDRRVFSQYETLTPFSVEMGDQSTAIAVGKGIVRLPIIVNEKSKMCEIRDVLH